MSNEVVTLGDPQSENNLDVAQRHLNLNIRPILGDEITEYWMTQTQNWTERFRRQTLYTFFTHFGFIPDTLNPDDAEKAIRFQLEHWMVSGDLYLAGNQTIAYACEDLLSAPTVDDIEPALKLIGGARARMTWEALHQREFRRINRKYKNAFEDYQIKDLDEQKNSENSRYRNYQTFLQYLQDQQNSTTTLLATIAIKQPEKFIEIIHSLKNEAYARVHKLSKRTSTIIGRGDNGYFDLNFYFGLWPQFGLVEEPNSDGSEPKGISVVFYRFNDQGHKEYYLCYGKKDAFAMTDHLTPAYQTSLTRIQQGNHPNQLYNPTLDSLADAFKQAGASNGVDIAYLSLNSNRFDKSNIAVATIDWNTYTIEQQQQIIEVLKKENRGVLRHAWITESALISLGRIGLIDLTGQPAPAINGFAAIAVGRRHPREIESNAINLQAAKYIRELLVRYPTAINDLGILADRLLENEDGLKVLFGGNTKMLELFSNDHGLDAGLFLRYLLGMIVTLDLQHKSIEVQYPHKAQNLPPLRLNS